jgi:hypothetical protein
MEKKSGKKISLFFCHFFRGLSYYIANFTSPIFKELECALMGIIFPPNTALHSLFTAKKKSWKIFKTSLLL